MRGVAGLAPGGYSITMTVYRRAKDPVHVRQTSQTIVSVCRICRVSKSRCQSVPSGRVFVLPPSQMCSRNTEGALYKAFRDEIRNFVTRYVRYNLKIRLTSCHFSERAA